MSVKEFLETRRRRQAMKIFMRLYADPKSSMQGILNEAAYKLAREMFMRMLDNEGFAHCRMCPIRGPLKKLAGTMMCDLHYQKATEANEALKSTQKKETQTNGTTNSTSSGAKEKEPGSKPDPSAV